MVNRGRYIHREGLNNMIWERTWCLEDNECYPLYKQPGQNYLLFKVIEKPFYLVWWIISDSETNLLSDCESMALMVCNTSLLKKEQLQA